MAKRILTPIDGRGPSETIVPVVAALARGAGSTVRLLRVFPVPEHVPGPYGRTIAYVDQEMSRLTAEGLDQLAHVEAEAFNADLVALATTRRSRLGSALVPNVAERVVRDVAVPTLVLRG